jgi:3-methyladenine DNA glycosylase AlkD
MNNSTGITAALESLKKPERALHCQKFFKTGLGEYGEGDVFLGISVPEVRKLVREYRGLKLPEIEQILCSPFHEARLFALLSMADCFQRGSEFEQKEVYNLYMNSTDRINGWDLVDCSAHHIPGAYLWGKNRQPLYDFAVSGSLWKRRISIIATLHFIRKNSLTDTLEISELLLNDKEDLIQKAVGWMLREAGKRDRKLEEDFLKTRYRNMPRTMLRYAIEKFDEQTRNRYLKGLI